MAGDDAGTTPEPAAGQSGACSVDLATGIVVLTGPLAELFGSAGDRRLTLADLRARIHPDDRQRVAEEIAAALDDAARSVVRTRFRLLRQDGSAMWLEARDRIERDDAGRAVATKGVMRAVAGRKRSEQPDLDWSRFEAALANTSIVLFQQDLALRYTWIHDPRLGFEAQSVLGMTDRELAGPEIAGPLDAIKRQVIETGQSARREVTMQGRRARGRYDLYVEPQRDDSGAVVGVTCAAIEIAAERSGAPSKLRQAISDRDALLDRLEARSGASGDRGLFTICTELLRRKLAGYAPLTREDAALLSLMENKRRFVAARQRLDIGANRTLLIGNGWVYSYKALANGDRQVVGFHLPGDLIGADGRGGEGRGGDGGFSYTAVTDCVVCEFDRAMAMKLRRSETVLPDALRWSEAREAAIVQQHLISIGRRTAIARVAHLLLELGARLKLVGLADDDGYPCPLSQELLGDALGLTKIHVNRMLRELRELGCLTFRNGRVTYGNMARLIDLAEYDPAYLDVSPEPAPNTGMRA
jgi:PAS domain S-box-containing protein